MVDRVPAVSSHDPIQPDGQRPPPPTGPWWTAQITTLALLTPLAWLLARLVWIYYFFGLFFFLVAGLLIGAVSFRVARLSRPITRGRLLGGIIILSAAVMGLTVGFEAAHFRDTVGLPPKFAEARNAAVQTGRAARDIQSAASDAFADFLRAAHPPGGSIGYILWSTWSGTATLTVDSVTETIHTPHAGWVWPIRTTVAGILLAAGLWFALESLRRDRPLSNVLPEGEEAEEWE